MNNTISHLGLTDIYKSISFTMAEQTLFSWAHKTFAKIDHILGYKTISNKFKIIQFIKSVFSVNTEIQFEINSRMIPGKSPNIKI